MSARETAALMDLCYGADTTDRRAAAHEVFATIALTAADLATDFDALPSDRAFRDQIADDATLAWMLALDGSLADLLSEDRAVAVAS